MKVLVTAATRHGSTAEIAAAIGAALERAGLAVDVRPPAEAISIEDYDAAVIGSGVYAGHWLDEAKDFVARNAGSLAGRPVWLFSSGPIGDPPKPLDEPVDVAAIRQTTGAREHRLIPGRIELGDLNFGERLIVKALRAPVGDFRPWPEIEAWAEEIAATLQGEAATTGPR